MKRTRREAIGLVGALGTAGLAGCLDGDVIGSIDERADSTETEQASTEASPPVADAGRHLAHEPDHLLEESLNGGVSQDGIPSIEEPSFAAIDEADLVDTAPVFGVVRDGEAKAYPQHILVWHEIVNDTIAGDPVSVTYCPLTGTVQGFERGGTTFGVSGELVNSNLIMYDRENESWWPQVLATAIDGPMRGETLREFRVVWTTVDEWRTAHPNSQIMTDDTGHARRYESDPYGLYAPIGGYYASERTMFPALSTPEEGHPKSVVIGARTADGALAVSKDHLRTAGLVTVDRGEARFVAVYEPDLDTAVVYRDGGDHVRPAGSDFRVGDTLSAPRVLRPADIALLAAMNVAEVPVRRRPEVALIATGDELVMPGGDPGPDQIVASNSFGLKALLEEAGAQARLLPIARDNAASLTAAFDLARGVDLIVTIGGASVGDHDLVGRVAGDLGLDRAFYKVAMRPGKPLMAGRMGEAAMVGLPGNPVSAMVCGHVFVLPMIAAMLGLGAAPAPRRSVRLAAPLEANGPREHYMRARLTPDGLVAETRQDSALLGVLAQADALLVRAAGDPPRDAGDMVEYLPV